MSGRSPASVALAWTTRSQLAHGVPGQREVDAERVGDLGARRVGVDQLDAHAGEAGEQRATEQPTIPPPTTAIRSPTSGAASHRAFTAVSTVPASTARSAGTPSGTGVTALAGTTYRVWCG